MSFCLHRWIVKGVAGKCPFHLYVAVRSSKEEQILLPLNAFSIAQSKKSWHDHIEIPTSASSLTRQSNDHFKARTFLIDDRFWIEYIIGNTAYDLKHQLRKLASNVEMFFWKFCKAVLLTAVTKTLSCRVIKFQITDYTINLKKSIKTIFYMFLILLVIIIHAEICNTFHFKFSRFLTEGF